MGIAGAYDLAVEGGAMDVGLAGEAESSLVELRRLPVCRAPGPPSNDVSRGT